MEVSWTPWHTRLDHELGESAPPKSTYPLYAALFVGYIVSHYAECILPAVYNKVQIEPLTTTSINLVFLLQVPNLGVHARNRLHQHLGKPQDTRKQKAVQVLYVLYYMSRKPLTPLLRALETIAETRIGWDSTALMDFHQSRVLHVSPR